MTQLNNPPRIAAAASGPKVHVPMADLRAQYNGLRSEMIAELQEVAGSTNYILGPKVAAFVDLVLLY